MQKRRGIFLLFVILFLLIFSSFLFPNQVFCYDSQNLHPLIAERAVEIYNQNFDPDITNLEKNWIAQGAMLEDTPTRWLNHFYDPVYDKGLWFITEQLSAKNWAVNSRAQVDFSLGDKSWQKGVSEFRSGSQEQAYKILGHLIHLLSDQTVPAHTREDIHVFPGDSYEQFLKNNLPLAKGFSQKNEYLTLNNLTEGFYNLAKYTNSHFYSDDTIEIKKYSVQKTNLHKLQIDNRIYLAALTPENNFLYLIDNSDWKEKNKKILNHKLVLSSYAEDLLPWAISNSAGLIKLFIEEAQKPGNNNIEDKSLSIRGKIDSFFSSLIKETQGVLGLFKKSNQPKDQQPNKKIEEYIEKETEPVDSIFLPDLAKNKQNIFPDNSLKNKQLINKENNKEVKGIKIFVPETNTLDLPKQESQNEQKNSSEIKIPDNASNGNSGYGVGGSPASEENIINQSSPTGNTPTSSVNNIGLDTNTTTLNTTSTNTTSTLPSNNTQDESEFTTSTDNNLNSTPTSTITTSTENYLPPLNNTSTLETASTTIDVPTSTIISEQTDNTTTTVSTTIFLSTPKAKIITEPEGETDELILDLSQEDLEEEAVFEIEYKNSSSTTWQPKITTTTKKVKIKTEPEKKYDVQVRKTTKSGSASNWQTINNYYFDWPKAVVINEIAWMGNGSMVNGGVNCPKQEWLELYNNTDHDFDLSGWKINVGNKNINLSGTIKAHDYYLLARKQGNTGNVVGLLEVDIGSVWEDVDLNNSGAVLILKNNKGQIVDKVDAGSGWFAGSYSGKYKTMFRLEPDWPGSFATNWQTSNFISAIGKSNNCGDFYGSPGTENTHNWLLKNLFTYYNHLIDGENKITLTKENSPYILDYETIVPENYTLQIDPGVVILGVDKFAFLNVQGNLVINGIAEDPVVFTSSRDRNYTNLNLPAFSKLTNKDAPEPGDWSRIQVIKGGSAKIKNARFSFGGFPFSGDSGYIYNILPISQTIRNVGSNLEIENSIFSNNYLPEKNKQFSSIVWTDTQNKQSATTTVMYSQFDGGIMAIKNFDDENPQTIESKINNCIFTNFSSEDGPIELFKSTAILENNIFQNNVYNGIYHNMEIISSSQRNWDKTAAHLVSTVTILPDSSLVIGPGTIVTIKKTGDILVQGQLSANGNDGERVVINSQDNKWGSIVVENGQVDFSYTDIVGGNNSISSVGSGAGMIYGNNSSLNFDHSYLLDARTPGDVIAVNNSSLTVTNSTIGWNKAEDSGDDTAGIRAEKSNLILDNVVFQNMETGFFVFDPVNTQMLNMDENNFIGITGHEFWPPDASGEVVPGN